MDKNEIMQTITGLGYGLEDLQVNINENTNNVSITYSHHGSVGITYDLDNLESLNSLFVVGQGTWGPGVHLYDDFVSMPYNSEDPLGTTTVSLSNPSTHSRAEADKIVISIVNALRQKYAEQDPTVLGPNVDVASGTYKYNACVVSGASANGINGVQDIRQLMDHMAEDPNGVKQPVHVMLIDAMNGDGNACQEFAKTLCNNDTVITFMRDTHSAVFSYPRNKVYNAAVNELDTVNAAGVAVVIVKNTANNEHCDTREDYNTRMTDPFSPESEVRHLEQERVRTMDFSPTGDKYLDANQYQVFNTYDELPPGKATNYLQTIPANGVHAYVDAYYDGNLEEYIEAVKNGEDLDRFISTTVSSHLEEGVRVQYDSVSGGLEQVLIQQHLTKKILELMEQIQLLKYLKM